MMVPPQPAGPSSPQAPSLFCILSPSIPSSFLFKQLLLGLPSSFLPLSHIGVYSTPCPADRQSCPPLQPLWATGTWDSNWVVAKRPVAACVGRFYCFFIWHSCRCLVLSEANCEVHLSAALVYLPSWLNS